MNLEMLKKINEDKLKFYLQYNRDNPGYYIKEIEIHTRIRDLFDKDEALFFKISTVNALSILSKLVPRDEIKDVYSKLVSGKEYKKLKKDSKI